MKYPLTYLTKRQLLQLVWKLDLIQNPRPKVSLITKQELAEDISQAIRNLSK